MAELLSQESSVSAYHLTDYALYEPARSNCFKFEISDQLNKLLFAGIDKSTTPTEADYLNKVQEIIRVSVIETSVPHFSIDPIEIRRGNSKVLFAGLPSFEAGSIKLNDFVGARVKDALMAWQALAYDVTTDRVQLASKYKYDCTLIEYNPDMTEVIRSWTLCGCWISAISEDSFNVEENSKRSITATVQFDRAYPTVEKKLVVQEA